ncbi:MAG TPA: hypothetical protein VLL48_12690 [Longimicrobiales bacterium]|nr:hypothetical protein [Longimicrobiales bacterium]
MSHGDPVETAVRQLHVMAGAFMGGVLVYTAMAVWVVRAGALGLGAEIGGEVLGLVGLVAALLLVLAPVVRRRILAAGRPEDRGELTALWIRGSIAGLAVREGAGLLGITISLLAGSVPWILGFGLASVAAMGLAWPRGEELREAIRRLEAGA